MSTLAKILVTCSLGLLLSSCNIVINGVSGSGDVIKKEKTLSEDFESIKASRGLDVILVNSSDHKVVIEANENLHNLIEVYVKEGVLTITSEKNIRRADAKKIYVSYQTLSNITATSGADVTSYEIVEQESLNLRATSGADIDLQTKANQLSTTATSGASIKVHGKVNQHNSSATSGADIRAKELLSLITESKATSGATIKVHAQKQFTGKATSGGDIILYGNPEQVSEEENSGGNIRQR